MACKIGSERKTVQRFTAKFNTIQDRYEKKLLQAKTGNECTAILKMREKELHILLNKYEKETSSDEALIIKSKIYIELKDFSAAAQAFDSLISKNSPVSIDAKMGKVLICIHTGQTQQALRLFKEIENEVENDPDRWNAWFHFSLYSRDSAVQEEYSKKFLGVENLPLRLAVFKTDIYRNLAAIARDRKELSLAEQLLKNAIAQTTDKKIEMVLRSETDQLKFIDKPAIPINPNTWFNSASLDIETLKGKVVAIIFWAPWCNTSLKAISVLNELHSQYSNKGLVIIGYTKLYGKADNNNEIGSAESLPIPKNTEVNFIANYIKRNKMAFPVSIADEGYSFEDYKVTILPTIVFIDKKGNISDIQSGIGRVHTFKNKIVKLLEETNGQTQSR